MKVNRYFLETFTAALIGTVLFFSGLAAWHQFGSLAAFLAPAPFLWLTARYGPACGAAASFLGAAVLLPLLPSPSPALSFLAGNALPAVLYGVLLRSGKPLVPTSLVVALTAVSLSIFAAAVQLLAAGVEVGVFLQYQYGDILREIQFSLELMTGRMAAPRADATAALMNFLVSALPAVLFVTICIQFSLNAILVLHVPIPGRTLPVARPSFGTFSLPEQTVWIVIPSLAFLLFSSPPLKTVALNASIVLLFLYLLQGLSISVHFMNRLRLAKPLRMLFLIAALLQPYILVFPLLAGLLDFRFDFRKPRPAPDA